MTDTLEHLQPFTPEDDRVLDAVDHREAPAAPPRLPMALVIAGAAVVVASAIIAFWPHTTTTPDSTGPRGFASGTTVDLVLQCSGPDAPCTGTVTAPDQTQWFWSTDVGASVPAAWTSKHVIGHVQTNGEWGAVTFTSNGQSITLIGGMATPDHTFFG